MKVFKILAGVAVLAVLGFAAFSWYSLIALQGEVNRKKTEAARANRWKRNENENEKANETELEKNSAADSSSDYTDAGGN